MSKLLPFAATLAALSATVAAQGAVSAPCFESNYGTNLNLTDDSIAANQALGFAFPIGATTVTSIDISSNGFVWLGSSFDSGCCNGDPIGFVAGLPRIAPMWMDLNPSAGGAVWFNTFPASGSTPASAVITWDNVPEYFQSGALTFQLQMFADGSVLMAYQGNVTNQFHTALTGITEGNNATANLVDLSSAATTPINSGTNPTLYEDQTSTFDLAGSGWMFLPNGTGGYLVLQKANCTFATAVPFGRGCPKPLTTYELFDFTSGIDLSNTSIDFLPNGSGGYVAVPGTAFFTGFAGAQVFGDDDSHGPFTLPFTFPFAGSTTNAIDISSNGFVWLQTGNGNSRCCFGDPTSFISDPASIAVLWQDLYPPGGGSIYFDTVGTTEAHITWSNVPEFGAAGSSNTCQITLRSDGSFRLAWGNVANLSHDCLVGITEGNSTIDPGEIDLSAGVFSTGSGGTPLQLAAQAGSRPVLGTTFTMDVGSIHPASVFGVMVFGFTAFPTGIDLTAIGMPGCELYASLDTLLSFPLAGTTTPFPLGVPNTPSLAGAVLEAQAATLTPGATPLNLLSSNGLELKLGL